MSNEYGNENEQGYGESKGAGGAESETMGATLDATVWDGSPTTITAIGTPPSTASLSRTDTGTMFVLAQDTSTGNNPGTIQWTAGGLSGQLNTPAGQQQPQALMMNFNGNSLSLTNISVPGPDSTPVQVMAAGTGRTSIKIIPFGTAITQYQASTTTTPSNPRVTLRLTAQGSTPGVVGIIGGPSTPPNSGNNGYLIVLNSTSGNTGVPSGQTSGGSPAPTPYYATTSNNTYDFVFTWNSAYTLWLCNLSSVNAVSITPVIF